MMRHSPDTLRDDRRGVRRCRWCRGGGAVKSVRRACDVHRPARLAGKLLSRLKSGTMVLADRGYDADWIRALFVSRAPGRIFHQKQIGQRRYASVHIVTGLAIWLSGFSTGSNNAGASLRATIKLGDNSWPSSSSPQYGSGCASMNPTS
jgi:hypothetical protein